MNPTPLNNWDIILLLMIVSLSISLYINLIMIFKYSTLLQASQQLNTAVITSCSTQPTCCFELYGHKKEIQISAFKEYLKPFIPGETT